MRAEVMAFRSVWRRVMVIKQAKCHVKILELRTFLVDPLDRRLFISTYTDNRVVRLERALVALFLRMHVREWEVLQAI